MRFSPRGPDIPGALLDARDEGQVVFFCGAGVSRARAGLPDFYGLAAATANFLGASEDGAARAAILAHQIGTGPAADRVFSLMEREFTVDDVRQAVARSIKPKVGVDLSAHRAILDLSSVRGQQPRVVTTNFDLLFESCDPVAPVLMPPVLPDLRRGRGFSGIVHLHGAVDPTYSHAIGDEFVLSSADFGRAYLADGWATAFMRSLIERFRIVFVGYSADDPPIQYLLEALARAGTGGELYAFQAGNVDQAEGMWRHKGVIPIAYDPADDHRLLWETLGAWAARAHDPEAWRRTVLARSMAGPSGLEPHERGQVAHLVSSDIGAKLFAEADPPPPAEWLCAFDSTIRHGREGSRRGGRPDGEIYDPFVIFGLDGDPTPMTNERGERQMTVGAWDAFVIAGADRRSLGDYGATGLRGHWSIRSHPLPRRLERLGRWLSRVADQTIALWWASGQIGVHPDVQDAVERRLAEPTFPGLLREGWLALLEDWRTPEDPHDLCRYRLAELVCASGWSRRLVRDLVNAERPRLHVRRPHWHAEPPGPEPETVRELVDFDVHYPSRHAELVVPDEFLADYLRGARQNLELAIQLEEESTSFAFYDLGPVERFAVGEDEFDHSAEGLTAYVRSFAKALARLASSDAEAARREVRSWLDRKDPVFLRLRLAAARLPALLTDPEVAAQFTSLSDEAFWDYGLERDLLFALKERWSNLPAEGRATVEQRLLAGPSSFESEDLEAAERRRLWLVAKRLRWLKKEALGTSLDIAAELEHIRRLLPEWSEADADDDLDTPRSRSGRVRTDTTYDQLKNVSLENLLDASRELMGSPRGRRDHFVERRPFRGLGDEQPVRALAALRCAAMRGEERRDEWSDFLWSEVRKADKPCVQALIAGRMIELPIEVLCANVNSATWWFKNIASSLHGTAPTLYARTWACLADAIEADPSAAASGLVRDHREPDWVTAGLNAPAGRLVEALMDEFGGEQQPADWRERAERLLGLPGDPQSHAIAMLAMRLRYLYQLDAEWTDRNLIALLKGDRASDTTRAGLAGFLQHGGTPNVELYSCIKPTLLALVDLRVTEVPWVRLLPPLLMAGWASQDETNGEQLVTDLEMREALLRGDERFRTTALFHLRRWANADGGRWATLRLPFIQQVWPRQVAVRSPAVSGALCDLAMSAGNALPQVAAVVAPLLSKVTGDKLFDIGLRRSDDRRITNYPDAILTMLHATLPDDAREWPYGVDQVVMELDGSEDLRGDPRLQELRRRLAAR